DRRVVGQISVGHHELTQMRIRTGEPGVERRLMRTRAEDHGVEPHGIAADAKHLAQMGGAGLRVPAEESGHGFGRIREESGVSVWRRDEAVDRDGDVVDELAHGWPPEMNT